MEIADVWFGDKIIGSATLERSGMVYKVRIECTMKTPQPYRIRAVYGSDVIPLGLCLQEGECSTLTKRIAVSRLHPNKVRFEAEPSSSSVTRLGEAPFEELEQLPGARIRRIEGALYMESCRPTGQ